MGTQIYKCEFPECSYTTDDRSLIEYHHIIPKSKGGTNKRHNRIWVCPNCHKRIYISGETHGQHHLNRPGRLELLRWLMSSGGKVLEYKTYDGEIKYYNGK